MVCGMEPIGAPFPGVAGYGIEAECIGRKGVDWRNAGETVFRSINQWKFALPDIAQVTAAGRELVSPRIEFLFETSARGKLPFGFRGKTLPCPGGVTLRVVPRNMRNWMMLAAGGTGIGTFGMPPIGARDFTPPIHARHG